MNMPTIFTQGDSLEWLDDPQTDPEGQPLTSDTWTLKTAIRGNSLTLDIQATPNAKGWRSNVSLAQSAALTPGNYDFQIFVQNDPVTPTKRLTLATGRLTVRPNVFAGDGTFDGRSQLQKDLENVESAIRALSAGGSGVVQEYTIGNRSVKKMSITDLIALRSNLKYRLSIEQRENRIADNLGDPFNVKVRF